MPVLVSVEPRIDGAGQMKFDITSADVGGIKAPDFVLKSVTRQLEDVLVQPFDDLPGTYYLYQETLKVQDGTFEVQGRVN